MTGENTFTMVDLAGMRNVLEYLIILIIIIIITT